MGRLSHQSGVLGIDCANYQGGRKESWKTERGATELTLALGRRASSARSRGLCPY